MKPVDDTYQTLASILFYMSHMQR